MNTITHHNVHRAALSITILPKGGRAQAKHAHIKHRPASFAYFTIEQLQHIITRVRHEPEREVHYFTFGNRRFRVSHYIPDEDETDATEDTLATRKFIPKVPVEY